MKVRIDERNNQKTRNGYLVERGLRSIKFVNGWNLAVRSVSVLLMTALLLPLIFFGQTRMTAAAQTASIVNQLPALVSAPAEPFVNTSPSSNPLSGSLTNTTLSTAVSLNTRLADGYRFMAGIFTTPALPEGFAMAKAPTFRERARTSLAPSISSLTSFIAPLVFVSPNGSSSAAKVKTDKAETNVVDTTDTKTNDAAAEAELIAEPIAPAAPLLFAVGTTKFDFTGDGKADASRWQPSGGEWKIKNSANGSFDTLAFGTGTSAAPADYDGDGITDRAIFDKWAGTWTIKNSSNAPDLLVSPFGQSNDKVVSGDYVGNAKADIAFFRPSNGTWYVRDTETGTVTTTQFGQAGDIPVAGNYDGDSKMDYAVFRPSTATWYVLLSGSGYSYTYFQWGAGTDTPVPADYDGDGKTDFAVYRPSNGTWYVNCSNGDPYLSKTWGNYGDQPVPADYDGDGKDDFAVWRPTSGVWFVVKSSDVTFNTYEYHQLGIPGDTAAPSSYLKQIGGQVLTYNLANARLAPKNTTGGTDLYSRNFSWGTGLVGLPGRAGLDAGFGISYNSLVWTKEPTDNTMVFDADNSNVSPGFRFGFPTIEPSYYNGLTGKYSYLMVTPSGGRVEFRQDAASGIYETADSSYTQLSVDVGGPNQAVEDKTLTVKTTDGTQMKYGWKAGAYRLNQIKDRNGNFITVVHDSEYGLLQSVTDTLGRVITVQYDSEFYPTTIKQDWKTNNGVGEATVQHTYATFSYTLTPITPNFDLDIGVFGPSGGTNIKVLQQITYPAGNSTTFEYNPYGQVWQIRQVAADSSTHVLNRVRTNLQTPTTLQTDCPRFSETYTKVENFNGGAETLVHNTFAVNQTFTGGGGAVGAADLVEVWMENAPDNTKSKTWYHPAGNWTEGLPFGTEDLAQNIQQRWTRTVWKQDDETQIYKINPRVTESRVGDETNTKKTTVDYLMQAGSTTASQFGLVSEVKVYDTNQTTVLKKAVTEYKWDAAYVSRRIIGLPAESRLYDQVDALMSKLTYDYDEGDFTGTEHNITPVQHDTTNYGASFITGRGNLTKTTRCDAAISSPTICNGGIASQVKYNTAGGAVSQIDPLGREIKIGYADSFNDGITTRNTYAYPTKLTDPAGNFSTVKYRYDTGANVWAQSPAPQNQSQGKTTERIFDSIGRLERQKIVNSGAYTRYEYGSDSNQFKTFSTVTDGAGEVVSESWTDGAGRVRQSRTEHPGSAGGWSGSLVEYDILGRVKRSTVPTEMNGSWNPTGDDNRGNDAQGNPIWQWQAQEYDWKSRVTREINVDGTDRLIFYAGCGCSGNQVVTVQSESVPRDDQPTVNARRTQKIYADALGRNWKTENLNWEAGVYTTTVSTFNGRDQITNTRQYAGTDDPNNTYQDASVTYDGHGRIKTRHYPIEDAGANTTWYYNADDSVQQVVDPRGATTNFTYNDARGLLTNIIYSSPNTTQIPDAPSVSFGYDAVGNRITMTDGTGTAGYAYDSLSRLTSETKTLTGLTGNFTIAYGYHIGGGLKSITDPFSSTVNYTNDKTGRLTSVSGTAFGDNTSGNYADNIQYRAFGAIKQMNYKTDDNALVSMQYDNRLRVSDYQVASAAVTGGFVQKSGFEYHADSRPKTVDNVLDAGFDRTFKYDFDGRLTNNQFGISTRPDAQQFTTYSQTIAYDAFSNMTSRQTGIWSGAESFTAAYTNGRRQAASGESLVFDALGNIVDITYTSGRTRFERSKFDAAGRMTEFSKRQQYGGGQSTFYDITKITTQFYDGDGERVKEVERGESTQNPAPPGVAQPVITETSKYYVRSTVTGKIITELDAAGNKTTTKVYVGSALLAEQRIYPGTQQIPGWSEVVWQHGDPVTGSIQQTLKSGELAIYVAPRSRRELEPLGGIVPTSDPYYSEEINSPEYNYGGDIFRPEFGCTLPETGQPAPCNVAAALMNYIGRVNRAFDPGYNQPARAGRSIPGFIRADNRRDDEFERIPGLRRVERYEGREFIGSVWAVDNIVAAQTQQPAPLTGKERRTFEEKQRKAVKRLNGDDCKEFLERIKSYASIADIAKQINTHPAFSAKNTNNLKVRDSGIKTPEGIREIENAPNNQGNNVERDRLNLSVADYFKGERANAITNRDPSKPGVFYYDGFDSQTVLHESIHFATGLADAALANALGLKNTDGKAFTDEQYRSASLAIKNALNKECK